MTDTSMPQTWRDIAPADAVDIDCTKRPDLQPPLNEAGEPCPWPWEPQLLVGAPMGQYHCGYCGAMCVAGIPHVDYRDASGEDEGGYAYITDEEARRALTSLQHDD